MKVDVLNAIILGCEEAGDFLLKEWQKNDGFFDVLIKDKDLKLDIDKISEGLILKKLAPFNVACYTEESGWVNGPRLDYVLIDGLDGTVNFANKIPIFTISAAIMSDMTPTAGVIVDPIGQKTSVRRMGEKLLVNQEHLVIDKPKKNCSQSVLLTAITPTFFEDSANSLEYLDVIKKFGKVRMLGSAAWSVSMLAEGNVDAVYLPNIYKWDVMGGVALLDDFNFDIKICQHQTNADLCTLFAIGRWVDG